MFLEQEDTLHGKPRFVSPQDTPDKFADEICSLPAACPGEEPPGHRKPSRQVPLPTRALFAPLQGHCGHGRSAPGAHHECIVHVRMTMRVGSMGPSMLDRSVASASDCIRTNRATWTHRSRAPHAPDICLFRQAHHDPILRDRATKFAPAELAQQKFSKKEIAGFPLVDMPLANSSWALPKGDEGRLARGFGIELYTLPLAMDPGWFRGTWACFPVQDPRRGRQVPREMRPALGLGSCETSCRALCPPPPG